MKTSPQVKSLPLMQTLPDKILKILTKYALEDTKNGERFIKFVINNKD